MTQIVALRSAANNQRLLAVTLIALLVQTKFNPPRARAATPLPLMPAEPVVWTFVAPARIQKVEWIATPTLPKLWLGNPKLPANPSLNCALSSLIFHRDFCAILKTRAKRCAVYRHPDSLVKSTPAATSQLEIPLFLMQLHVPIPKTVKKSAAYRSYLQPQHVQLSSALQHTQAIQQHLLPPAALA